MAYIAPYVDSSGIHVPMYSDIRDALISEMRTIFGQDIYLEEDSQDYQQISIFAKKIYDTNALAVLAYNNRTVNTAIGVGLDNLCALVGITRKPATYSTVQLTVTGSPSTIITNGQAYDGTYYWNLPSEVEIPTNGIVTVLATCDTAGEIYAAANTITQIATPVYGWLSVTNNYSASPGVDLETDAELRERYQLSTQSPSTTVFNGIISGIKSVSGVTKVVGYENDTNANSTEGFPPHSITMVVEGGEDEDVASEIYYRKTPGCYTNGTTSVNIQSVSGDVTTIRFYRPTEKPVYVKVTIKKLSSYNNIFETEIQNAIVEYINGLNIAEDVYNSILWSVAVSQMDTINNPAYSVVSVQTSTDNTSFDSNDIEAEYNELFTTSISNVQVVVND